MEVLKRIKKYKEVSPEETVNRIKKLLKHYGIEVNEQFFHINTASIDSCRIFISNGKLKELSIGTNGKGMNIEFTKASAYAEFMERLENNALLPKLTTNKEKLIVLDEKEARPYYKKYFEEVFGANEKVSKYIENNTKSVYLLEVDDVFNNKKTYIPINLILLSSGSNGMCAGNSKIEAILQGISEIFERYVQYELTMNNLTPPEIDKKYFSGTEVIKRLDELEKDGCKYQIYDCSLGKGYPVIGIKLTYHNKYRIRLGSDPSPITALERCFTEIFQGYNNIFEAPFVDFEDAKKDMASFDGSEKQFWFNQYLTETHIGNGYYPEGIIKNGVKPSYEFKGFEHPVSKSNEDDLEYYYDIIRRNNKHLYIADRSNMGFPAYYIFIPSISEIIIKDDGEYFFNRLKNNVTTSEISEIPFMDKEGLLSLASKLINHDKYFGNNKEYTKEYFPFGDFVSYHRYKLIAFLYACANEKEKANEYLEKFLETNIGKYEPILLNRKLVKEGKIEDCFPLDKWPICPRCDKCKVSSQCRHKELQLLNEQIISKIPN